MKSKKCSPATHLPGIKLKPAYSEIPIVAPCSLCPKTAQLADCWSIEIPAPARENTIVIELWIVGEGVGNICAECAQAHLEAAMERILDDALARRR